MSLDKWSKAWNGKPRRETIGKKVKEFVKPPASIRQQVIHAIYRLNAQMQKLEYSYSKLLSYDKQLFEKVVQALIDGDKNKAYMYAQEVYEIRKMAKVILTVKHALEKVRIKLETFLIIGDVQASLAPAVVALKEVSGYMRGMMPDVFAELMEIDEALQVTMMQTAYEVPGLLEGHMVSEEAHKIIQEASIVAEQRLKQQFPELPTFDALQAPTSGSTTASVEEAK